MPISARQINKAISGTLSVEKGSSCYLLIKGKSKRFYGVTNIGSSGRRKYKVYLGYWQKDFNSSDKVLQQWNEMKTWGLENNCDLRRYGERFNVNKSEVTLKKVVDLFIQHKTHHQKSDSSKTFRNRFDRILRRLPDGILVDDLAGYEGTQFIKEKVLDPDVAQGKIPTAKRYRQMLNNLFNYAVADRLVHPEQIPYRLDMQFPFESEHKSRPHPHLSWNDFSGFLQVLNLNPCNADRLTDLSTKAVLLMLTRVSTVVSMQWDWFDADKDCWVIPSETTGLKRKKGDMKNHHYIPNTPQLSRLMDSLRQINRNEKYVFYSPYKGRHPYVSKQTPNDHLKNLGYQGRQDVHGFRHVATNALVDKCEMDERMVSRCLGHLHKDGSIGHYDFAERIKPRKVVHECWNQLLDDEGLRV